MDARRFFALLSRSAEGQALAPELDIQLSPDEAIRFNADGAAEKFSWPAAGLAPLVRRLPPKSCLVWERRGRVSAALTSRLGLNLNWLREGPRHSLVGDIGLECDTGLEAQAAYAAQGHWLVMAIREGEAPRLRLRVEKQAATQLDLALRAKADFRLLTPSPPPAPGNFPAELLPWREKLQSAALAALKRQHLAWLALAFSRTTAAVAFFDATLPLTSPSLEAGLHGDLAALLSRDDEEVVWHKAQLSRLKHRHTSIEVTLPFLRASRKRTNEVLAECEVVEADGRVLVYEVKAQDRIATPHRHSSLSLGISLGAKTGAAVRTHRPQTFALTYTLRQAQAQYQPAALSLAPHFTTAQLPAPVPGAALFALTVNLVESRPGALGEVWVNLPEKASDPLYQRLSTALQVSLRQLVPALYFAVPGRYRDIHAAAPLLYWAALPARNHPAGHVYWDWPSLEERRAMLAHPLTQEKLRTLIGRARLDHPEFALPPVAAGHPLLHGLLDSEARLIDGFVKAGRSFAKLRGRWNTQPARALDLLNDLASTLTRTLHDGAASVYLGPMARTLGPALFAAASQSLAQGEAAFTLAAHARLGLLPAQAADAAAFLASGEFPEAELLSSYGWTAGSDDALQLLP
jgi:hypothetical protein